MNTFAYGETNDPTQLNLQEVLHIGYLLLKPPPGYEHASIFSAQSER